ncbi:MAG: helix-turn-helix transcriptional regulator [Clostridium sp.]|uniref:helix-turn-helix domain-containing protein n=1 Tax=Clostridium sp. TaxID=1506 RepID=UPI0030229A33
MYPKFAKLLQNNNMTAYKVAKDTEISTSTLSDWKTGRSIPKVDKLKKIADYFGVSITYFLENDTDEN